MASKSTSRAPNFSRLSRRFHHIVDTVTSESASPDAPEDTGGTAISQNDPLWTDYVKRAASFDQRIIDDWNKILDVSLIFVGLFISTLASFVVNAPQQFKPDPADISNQLLAAIYIKLANNSTGSNNTIAGTNYNNTDTLIQQHLDPKELHQVLVCNALLYSSLGLCCVASMFALAAKLWLISYDHRRAESSFGTPRERAMERQKAYSGVLVWKMGAVIQSLPLILLIAVGMFEFFVHQSISSIQVGEASYLGYAIGTLLSVTVMALGITSLVAAFIPACPFSTPLSTIIQLLHINVREYVRNKLNNRKPWDKVVSIGILILLWFGSVSAIGWATIHHKSSNYISFICIPIAITLAFAAEWETDHKPQKYILPVLSLWTFVAVGSIQAAAAYFPQTHPHKFIGLYTGGMFILFIFGVLASQLSKSMGETAEIDAITWLLTESESTPSQLFKEATGRILKNPVGIKFQPRLMNSLIPFLSPLIISYSNLETQTLDLGTQTHDLETQTHDLEIYVRCLADLSKFEDEDGSYWVLKEDARSHPKLRKNLIASLTNIQKKHQSTTPLGAAAEEILAYYGENGRKRPKSHKRHISGDSASMMTVVDSGPVQVHAYEEMELHSRLGHKNGYCRVDV